MHEVTRKMIIDSELASFSIRHYGRPQAYILEDSERYPEAKMLFERLEKTLYDFSCVVEKLTKRDIQEMMSIQVGNICNK